ncbi:Rha family transcriptional regulator [Rhizobium rhizogenes]|uniref:Rha family transcriptional regulator n=1 Tax=Rhizobium rhizogenes TaxID=359 RepID=UPI00226D89B2|nr:Rha family transcriptional regulator [Rhizobium rhizogenes]
MDVLTNSMPSLGGKPETMTSLEIADLVEKRHDNVKRTIETLLEQRIIQLPQTEEVKNHLGQRVQVLKIGERDSFVVVAQLSPEFTARLVDYWQAHRNRRPMTAAEMFLQNAQILVDLQNQQAKHQAQLLAISDHVEKVAQAQTVMSSVPANAESIVHLRKRIWKMFGLSDSTVDAVMRQSPYAPKPAGVVRNNHVDAENSTFAVWWKKDVTALFHRFADECAQVSDQFFTHPFVEGRFKMVPPADAGMTSSRRKS